MNPFWTTWSQELAYVLGFAFADGAIGRGRNSLTIAQSDREILDDIKRSVGFGDIKYSVGAKVWRLRFCEHGLNATMAIHGIIPNKTVHGFWPYALPENLIRHYVRGYFDGDGGISRRWIVHGAIVGFVCHNEAYLVRVREEILKSTGDAGRMFKDGNNYRLRLSRNETIKKMSAWLYTDATIFIRRKKEAFDSAIVRISRGMACGERHLNAKLTDEQVGEIKRAHSQCGLLHELPAAYGVSSRLIRKILSGETWKHVNEYESTS